MANQFQNYPVWRTMTQNNQYAIRIMTLFNLAIQGMFLLLPLMPFLAITYKQYNLQELNQNTRIIKLPYNTFQHRQSAHYLEINQRYMYLMAEEYQNKYQEIAEERKQLGREEKLMKYADPSYTYAEPQNAK